MGRSTWRRWSAAVAVGLVLVAVLLAVVAARRDDVDPPPQAEVVDGFLAAYERSRTEELLVTSIATRRLNDGRELVYEVRDIRRPPDDVLVVGAGSVAGRRDGRILRCNTLEADDPASCIQGPVAPPWDEEVADEVRILRDLVTTAYEVEDAGDGCWDLRLVVAVLSPPYGGAARFCFDEATGALRYREVRRAEGVDLLEATDIRTTVTDADLRAPDLGEPIATG